MIVSRSQRYVFLCMPRTASHSVSHFLVSHCDGEECGTAYHDFKVPPEFQSYLTFTFVRDPWTWLPSMWRQAVRAGEIDPLSTFAEFVGCMRQRWDWGVPQSEWIGRAPDGHITILNYEDLPDNLTELPFIDCVPSLPHMIRSDLNACMLDRLYASRENRRLVQEFCAEDFFEFGIAPSWG